VRRRGVTGRHPSKLIRQALKAQFDGERTAVWGDGSVIELFIVTDVKLYREGLTQALEQADSFRVVGAASRIAQLDADMRTRERAVLLFDVQTPDEGAILEAVLTANPNMRAVAVGVTENEPEIIAWTEAGASGYVTRDGSVAELIATIEAVARDEFTCPPRITAALMHRVAMLATEQHLIRRPQARLSGRELEILYLLEDGLSNQEIAHRLFIALATVKNHVHNILDKLHLRTRAEAAAWARCQRINGTQNITSNS
jgi:two-component system nitrate/nitrite response regulator NarL